MACCCKQVREFVHFGKELHGKIKELYEELNEEARLERVRMVLEFLARHEEHMEEALARFEKDTRKGILEAWLEYKPELDVEAVMGRFPVADKPSSDELFQLAMEFDDTLVKLYREGADKAHDARTKEVFQSLLRLEEREKIQLARTAFEFEQM